MEVDTTSAAGFNLIPRFTSWESRLRYVSQLVFLLVRYVVLDFFRTLVLIVNSIRASSEVRSSMFSATALLLETSFLIKKSSRPGTS